MIPKPEAFMRLPFVIVGKHTKMRPVHMRRAKRVTVVSEEALEGQVDGEVMLASAYDIQLVPSAMTAIVPAEKPQ
jgi:diacylglycerol kinase family enzyme